MKERVRHKRYHCETLSEFCHGSEHHFLQATFPFPATWAPKTGKIQENQKSIEDVLVKGLSYILRRTVELSPKDQLAIAQEYKEWINCISASDFSKQEILIIDEFTFN